MGGTTVHAGRTIFAILGHMAQVKELEAPLGADKVKNLAGLPPEINRRAGNKKAGNQPGGIIKACKNLAERLLG